MPSAANIRETRLAFGYKPESAINTINSSSAVWSLNVLNDTIVNDGPIVEDDAKWIGKGNEFPTQTFTSHWNTSRSMEKYCSSQFLAHLAVFGLGVRTKSSPASGVYQYVCTPLDPTANGIDMGTWSFIEAIRQGGSSVFDRAYLSAAWEDFLITIGSGPGLANSKVVANWISTGALTEPSGITIPTQITEAILPASSMALTVNGVNYVSSANIISCDSGWKNNIRADSAIFPGSGFRVANTPASGQIRGRQEIGDRVPTFRFSARFKNGSSEITTLKNQSSGTATMSLTGPVIGITAYNHSLTMVWQKMKFRSATLGQDNGIVSVGVEGIPMFDNSNGILTMTVITDIDLIGG